MEKTAEKLKVNESLLKTVLCSATFWGLLAALCHAMKWSIHTHFNYNDISHIFMTISVIYYYKGYSKLDKSLIGHGSRL